MKKEQGNETEEKENKGRRTEKQESKEVERSV